MSKDARGRTGGRLALIAAVVLLAAPAAATAETRPGYGGELVGSVLGEPASLDPVAARAPAEVAVVGLLFDTLYRIGPDGVVVPHLAAALPEVAGNQARIELRPGIRFHDGSALTAADVAASLARVRTSVGAGWLLAGVAEVVADGEAVVVVRFKTARKDAALLLAAPQTAITRRGQDPTRGKTLIGSGPFRLGAARGDRLVLEAHDAHLAGRAYVDRVTLRWFTTTGAEARLYETGAAHWSLRGATSFGGRPPPFPTGELESPPTVLVYLGFGGGHRAVTGDREFRAAIDAALTRRGLDHVGTGERAVPTQDPVPEELGGPRLADQASDARLELARAALTRAGAANRALHADRLGQLSLEILVDQTRPDDREIAERVVRALDRLGIKASIAAVAAPELARRIATGTADLYIGQLVAAVASPGFWFAQAYALGGERAAADQLTAGGAVDLARVRATFARRLPIVPLLHRAIRVHHRAAVRGGWFDASARLGVADLFLWGAP